MFCPHCGSEIPDQSMFCTKCGESVKPKSAPAPESAAPAGFQPQQAPAGFQTQQPPMAGQAVPTAAPPAKKSNNLVKIIAIALAAAIVVALCICIPKCGGGGAKAVDKDGNITPAAVTKNTSFDKIQSLAFDNGYTVYNQDTEDGYTYVWYEGSDELEDDFVIYSRGEDIVLAQFYVMVGDSSAFKKYLDKYCDPKHVTYYDCNGDGQADYAIADSKVDGRDAYLTAQLDSDGLATIALIDEDWIDEYFKLNFGDDYLTYISDYTGLETTDMRELLEYIVIWQYGGTEL